MTTAPRDASLPQLRQIVVKLPTMTPNPIPLRPDFAFARRASHETAMRSLTRASIATASRIFSERDRSGAMPDPEVILRRRGWGDDKLAAMLTRATATPAMTTTTGWAAELATVSQALLDSLTPLSAGAQILSQGHSLTFDDAATIKVPSLSGGAASWLVEGSAIRVVNFLSSAPTLSPHKLAAIAVLTQEMVSSGNAEQFVRQALVDSCASAIDMALFSSTAASASQPSR
jgi:hypothetical protein